MYRLIIASLIAVAVAGCGGAKNSPSTSTAASPSGSVSSAAPAAAGCTASGLDAMTALSDFENQMNAAQKAGKFSVDTLIASRNKLFDQTQAASAKEDWTAYCKAIDDMRTELGM